ncbi:MAG: hypothetical protein AAF696_18145, partial [Bacteroidota bacterium]
MRKIYIFIPILLLLGFFCTIWLNADETSLPFIPEPGFGQSDLRFIENDGQWDTKIKYKARLNGGDIYFAENELTYHLYNLPKIGHGHGHWDDHEHEHEQGAHEEEWKEEGHIFRMKFEGSNTQPHLKPNLRYPNYHNYFIGNEPASWKSGVNLFGQIDYQELYPGIDLRFYGWGNSMKYDFVLDAGVSPDQIRIRYEGLDKLKLKDGSLIMETAVRTLTELPPIAYQVVNGSKKEVEVNFRLKK